MLKAIGNIKKIAVLFADLIACRCGSDTGLLSIVHLRLKQANGSARQVRITGLFRQLQPLLMNDVCFTLQITSTGKKGDASEKSLIEDDLEASRMQVDGKVEMDLFEDDDDGPSSRITDTRDSNDSSDVQCGTGMLNFCEQAICRVEACNAIYFTNML